MTDVAAAAPLTRSPRGLRDELERMVRDDLIGPVGGDFEELPTSEPPSERYLAGMLAPREYQSVPSVPDEELGTGNPAADSPEEGAVEPPAPAVEQLMPSAFGMTFVVEAGCARLEVVASWGAYTRGKSEVAETAEGNPRTMWQRQPAGGTSKSLALDADGDLGVITPDADYPQVLIKGRIRTHGSCRVVTLFLVNEQDESDFDRAGQAAWLFQVTLGVRAPDGRAVFVRRPVAGADAIPEVDRDELASLDMLYRHEGELAVGHGIATHATHPDSDRTRATRIETVAMPTADVALTEAPTVDDFANAPAIQAPFAKVITDMQVLGEAADADLPGLLTPLADAYDAWITEQQGRLDRGDDRLDAHKDAGQVNLAACRDAGARIRLGIDALGDPDVAEAFRFANLAMWQQRVHTLAGEELRRAEGLSLRDAIGQVDEPKNRSWRPFQLAFVLLNLPALADPCHPERTGDDGLVDLLFFPTGGGKTEAYLGLTAFTLAIRRLQGVVAGRSGADGVAVLMRYTLRLLTLQQFQRAAALICACELLRRDRLAGDPRWGTTPFRIGLWVGRKSTPTNTAQAAEWAQRTAKSSPGGGGGSGSPMQLARCPWCSTNLVPGRDLKVDKDLERTLLYCGDKSGSCPFTGRHSPGEGLPVVVVDSELYRLVPSLVIATVDKFALMPWIGATQALFGRVSRHCPRHGFLTPDDHEEQSHPKSRDGKHAGVKVEPCGPLRPPDLVIQDELHLIAGPLGSLVGLYETAIDRLCSWDNDGHRAGPKLIASTATIRRARLQVDRLYARKLAVFPPPALDARDTFFSIQRDRPSELDDKPGRRYVGICAPGRRFKGILIRVYTAMLGAAQKLLEEHPGDPADAYMTLVGYFNSLRELGGTRRIVEDDVQTRIYGRRIEERGFKARGRLEVEELTSRRTADEIPKVLDKLGVQHEHPRRNDTYPIDVLLATNMISVGVDVPRLGAMIVAGQPKSTSEYIQATSRVGRRFPGLVLTVFNWARPRDLSHYETFEHYHATVYRQVEALSVTPFAPMALRRGLTGVLGAMIRLSEAEWNANEAAATVPRTDARLADIVEEIAARAADRANDKDVADLVRQELEHRLDQWKQEQDVPQRELVYSRGVGAGTQVGLLHSPDGSPWTDFTVPMSMRDVEPSVDLVLRDRGIVPVSEVWEMPTKDDEQPEPEPDEAHDEETSE